MRFMKTNGVFIEWLFMYLQQQYRDDVKSGGDLILVVKIWLGRCECSCGQMPAC